MPAADDPKASADDAADAAAAAAAATAAAADLAPVPRLPRGRGLKLDRAMLFRIFATLALLTMLLVMRRPCADATSKFVTGFGSDGSNAPIPKPGTIDLPATGLGSGSGSGSGSAVDPMLETMPMNGSDADVRAAWERARAKARAAAGSGSNR